MSDRILHETKHLRFIDRDGWYFVERPNSSGVVVIVAVTNDGRLIMVEQHRPALGRKALELPAGLCGDDLAHGSETLEDAAGRELLEETGWQASRLEKLATLATAAGLTSEMVTYYRATGLRQVHAGGGVDGENIEVHAVPLAEVPAFAASRETMGHAVSVLIYAGLWFAANPGSQR